MFVLVCCSVSAVLGGVVGRRGPGLVHGTLTGYTNYSCRCVLCGDCWREYQRRRRGSKIVERTVSGAAADPLFWEKVRVVQGLRYGRGRL